MGVAADLVSDERIIMTVFLPQEAAAAPYGPLISRSATGDDSTLTAAALPADAYQVVEDERDGTPGVEMRLDIKNPRLSWYYRLAWDLAKRHADRPDPTRHCCSRPNCHRRWVQGHRAD